LFRSKFARFSIGTKRERNEQEEQVDWKVM